MSRSFPGGSWPLTNSKSQTLICRWKQEICYLVTSAEKVASEKQGEDKGRYSLQFQWWTEKWPGLAWQRRRETVKTRAWGRTQGRTMPGDGGRGDPEERGCFWVETGLGITIRWVGEQIYFFMKWTSKVFWSVWYFLAFQKCRLQTEWGAGQVLTRGILWIFPSWRS